MTIPSFHVDLDLPPEERWRGIEAHKEAATDLLSYYVNDLGGLEQFKELLSSYRDAFVPPQYVTEMRAIATLIGRPEAEVLLSNLYYDAIKHLIGCTAFAIDTPDGPLHARNLDWGTVNAMLSRHTLRVEYSRAGQPHFTVIGWPGYAGALSGMAPNRFSVTLNAVLSDDPPELVPPVTFLLRDVLDTARNFDEAVTRLRDSPVTSDSLLLISGVKQGEMVVIERSPKRAAVRTAVDGFVALSNDYRSLPSTGSVGAVAALAETSCRRFERAGELIAERRPTSPDECFAVLDDAKVRMDITVQSMVFSASKGLAEVRLPRGSREGA